MTTEKQILRKEHHKEDEVAGEDEEVRRRRPRRGARHSWLRQVARFSRRPPLAVVQVIYKIDIPANRYDMLCVEVRARAHATAAAPCAVLTRCARSAPP